MKLALAGDTMLGRKVGERLAVVPPAELFSEGAAVCEADLFVLNLECAISDRGRRWPDPSKPFFFRVPRSVGGTWSPPTHGSGSVQTEPLPMRDVPARTD